MLDACQIVQRHRASYPYPSRRLPIKPWQAVPHHCLVLKEETQGAGAKKLIKKSM